MKVALVLLLWSKVSFILFHFVEAEMISQFYQLIFCQRSAQKSCNFLDLSSQILYRFYDGYIYTSIMDNIFLKCHIYTLFISS